jgi:hypothetical protein
MRVRCALRPFEKAAKKKARKLAISGPKDFFRFEGMTYGLPGSASLAFGSVCVAVLAAIGLAASTV